MEESRGLRRSARLSALDTSKTNKTTDNVGPVGVARGRGGRRREKRGAGDRRETSCSSRQCLLGKRRGRKRKSSAAVPEETTFSSVEEDGLAEERDDSSSYNIGNSSRSSCWLPEKQILELILNTLQKRDSHEMFAKPVDPKKVEDYYEVIQNPVDFSKMRNKLQAGMYKSLKQFEEDVFVMFNNAMNFNDSNTLLYRQAHSLLDLAKRIFHALKTNPSNFEAELSAMKPKRGRPCRKDGISEGEATRAAGNNYIASAVDHIPCGRHRSLMNGAFGLKEKLAESSTIMLGPSPRLNRRCANDDFLGLRYGQKYNYNISSSDIEPRDTYMPISSDSPLHCRPLIYVGQCNVGYIDSLARFTSDLGPSAQRMALKMLRGMSEKQLALPPHPAPPMQMEQQQQESAAADHTGESSSRPPHGRIEIPPSVYCPPRFGIPDDSHHDAEASSSLNHAFGSMIRTTSAGISLNPMSEEEALISRYPPPAATSSIHALRSETPPPGSTGMRLPSASQQQQLPTVLINDGDPNDHPTSSALRNIKCYRRNRHAGSDGLSFMPPAAADRAGIKASFRNPSFSQPPASRISPISPNPLLAYDSINYGSWSSFPAAQINPTVEAANYSFTDFLATQTRNENSPSPGPVPAAVSNPGNNAYMAMMAAASAMPLPGLQLRPSGDPESDLGGQSKLLELVSRNNNNPALLPLMLQASATPIPAPAAAAAPVANLHTDHLGGENNQGGVAAAGLIMSSSTHDQIQGLSLGQSSAWGQANVGHDMISLFGQQYSRVGEIMDYSWGLDGISKPQQLPDPTPPETLFFNAIGGSERASSCHGRRQFEPSVNPPLSDTTQLPDLALQL